MAAPSIDSSQNREASDHTFGAYSGMPGPVSRQRSRPSVVHDLVEAPRGLVPSPLSTPLVETTVVESSAPGEAPPQSEVTSTQPALETGVSHVTSLEQRLASSLVASASAADLSTSDSSMVNQTPEASAEK